MVKHNTRLLQPSSAMGITHQVVQASALFLISFLLVGLGKSQTVSSTLRSPATYWVTFSKRMRPGTPLAVSVNLLEKFTSSTVTVWLRNDLNKRAVAVTPPGKVVGGEGAQVFQLQIPRNIKSSQTLEERIPSFTLLVQGFGNLTFQESDSITLEDKAFSIFVQTDKAIYKPGQTVKVRAMAVYPDLTVLKEPLDVLIQDPKGNIIKQWFGVQGVSNTGVVELSMPTSNKPPLGDWSIKVSIPGYVGNDETKTFTIDEYVLPNFEVNIDLPSYILTYEPLLSGKVSAKYTFGKPLTNAKATVTARFESGSSVTYNSDGSCNPEPVLSRKGLLNMQGEMEFSFTNQELLDLAQRVYTWYSGDRPSLENRVLKVTANVTDTENGQKMGAVSTLQFYRLPAKVEFLPITANVYKPMMKYTAYLSVTKPDGKTFENTSSIVVDFRANITIPRTSEARASWSGFYSTESVTLTTITRPLPASGFISFDLTIPSQATQLTLEAQVSGATAFKSVSKAVSPSNNFLQITTQTEKPRVGENMVLSIQASEPVQKITYQIYAKGVILTSGETTAVRGNNNSSVVNIQVTSSMAPNCRVLVFYFRSNGEVVADSLSFKVDLATDNSVSLSFSKSKVKPGQDVDLQIRARPNSAVFLLAVDKSVSLLKTGNDITQNKIAEELVRYDYGSSYNNFWRYMVQFSWPYPSEGLDADGIFRDAKVAMLTDGQLKEMSFFSPQSSNFFADAAPSTSGNRLTGGFAASQAFLPSQNKQDSFTPVERVRTFFPETWLWDFVLLDNTGRTIQRRTAPDTITTWLTSAFTIHPQFGLSVIPETANLTTFKDVFVSLDLPYSAIRGEDLCLKAFAFNYYPQPVTGSLTMGRSDGISAITLVSQSGNFVENRTPRSVSRQIGVVPSDQVRETTFCFTPTKLGNVPIRVNFTTTSIAGDGVEQTLLVEPEGVPRSHSVTVVLDVNPGTTFTRSVGVVFPSDVVQGSQRITVSVAGDLLGPVFQNLDKLLRLPYGCGEQNMLYFAPNVYLINYLQRTNSYTPEVAAKAENYMLTGYQREIQYQHNDGSYSSFGQKYINEPGSMWLTAFVTKCFVQSMKLKGGGVNVDPKIVTKSIQWMISRQLPSGVFPEPGVVFNKEMQGGSGNGEPLTAYVLAALAEADASFEGLDPKDKSLLQSSISSGQRFLEGQLSSLIDPYAVAIVTYALHLVKSQAADTAFRLLSSKAVREPLMVHWERPKVTTRPAALYAWERSTNAINIEMTSYALLTFVARRDLTNAYPVIRWLVSQRGPEGGFISTQDTVMGLQALSELAAAIYTPNPPPITVIFRPAAKGQPLTEAIQFTIDKSSKLLLQQSEIRTDNTIPDQITISAVTNDTNKGIAVAEVQLDYNVLENTRFTTFALNHTVEMSSIESFVLTLEASRVDGKVGGMTLIEVGVPTGYAVDTGHPEYDVTGSRLQEVDGRKYILYYDELGGTPVHAVIPFRIISGIPVNLKPTPIKIYDYYENGGNQQLTTSYELKLLKSNSICDRQPDFENCSLMIPQKIKCY